MQTLEYFIMWGHSVVVHKDIGGFSDAEYRTDGNKIIHNSNSGHFYTAIADRQEGAHHPVRDQEKYITHHK